jgi:DNA-nicking Smr family endonuclease
LNDKISKKDKLDWENFISNKEKLLNKDAKLKQNQRQKVKSIDLHGYTLDQANKKIEDFINQNFLAGVKKLIVVTGKGLHSENEKNPYVSRDLSILKYSVPEYIKNNKNLINKIYEFGEAKIEDGGSGAFYIYLKTSNKFKE